MNPKIRAFAATSMAMAVTLCAAPAAQAVPAKFWGVVPQATPTVEQFQRLKQGGVDSVRTPIVWSSVQPAPGGTADWSSVDGMIRGAPLAVSRCCLLRLRGAELGCAEQAFRHRLARHRAAKPAGEDGRPARRLAGLPPPRRGSLRSQWQLLAREPHGSKATDPDLEVWNEPNFKFLRRQAQPVEYGQMVKLHHTALRSVDPGAKVILAGLFSEPREAVQRGAAPGLLRHGSLRADVPVDSRHQVEVRRHRPPPVQRASYRELAKTPKSSAP